MIKAIVTKSIVLFLLTILFKKIYNACMAKRVAAKKTSIEKEKPNTSPASKQQLSNALAKLTIFKPKSYNQILVVLLIMAAFLIGVLYTKVSYLEKGGSLNNGIAQEGVEAGTPPAAGEKVDVDKGHLPALGDKNAKVVMIDFSDFECPFCKQYFDQTFGQIKKDYIDTGKVVYYYRHFPLDFHPAARPSALASECANEQGKFWEFHDLVFKDQAKITGQTPEATILALKTFAANLSLNTSQFNTCLDTEKYKDNVDKDYTQGGASGVNGTPGFFINGVPVVGAQPYSAFKAVIDQELSK